MRIFRNAYNLICCASGLLLLAGCSYSIDMRPEPNAPTGDAATLRSREPCYIEKVDGKSLTGFHDNMPHDILIAPGMHTAEIYYHSVSAISRMNAEITFVAEKGKRYQPMGWPPRLMEFDTNEPAQQKLRRATP